MTFLHKLAHRLARLKAAFAIGLVGALACERIAQTTDPSGSVSRLDLSPKSLTLMTNQTTKFTVVALTSTGDTTNVAVSWSVTGGTITDSTSNNGQHYGKYKAPGQTGQYKVRATGAGRRIPPRSPSRRCPWPPSWWLPPPPASPSGKPRS